jgi:hypothetical protein
MQSERPDMNASAYTMRSRAFLLCAAAASCVATFGSALAAEPAASDAIVERVRADLAGRRGIASSEIRIVAVSEVTWRDTSMGCGKPTESYAQIDVAGWQIALEYNGERFDYRARRDGGFILCTPSLNSPR